MPTLGGNIAGAPVTSIVREPAVTKFTDLRRTRITSRVAPRPAEEPRGPVGAVQITGDQIVKPAVVKNDVYAGDAEDAGFLSTVKTVFQKTGGTVTTAVADKLNVEPETVKNVGLISLIGTGAGLLANGVKSLFDGTLKEKRAAKKAEKEQAKVEKQAAVLKAAFGQPTGGAGIPAAGGATASASLGGMQASGKVSGVSDFLQKNWMVVALAALLLFGGNLFKTRRAPRRRSPRTKVVTRYRTRRAPARRRRR